MTTIKEYTTDELLLIAHNVTCEYSPQKVRRAKRELYARGVTDKVIADIIEEEEAAFDRRLKAEKYDLMFKQRLWMLIGGDLAWGVWAYYKYFWGGGL